jgi:hypothetical protein
MSNNTFNASVYSLRLFIPYGDPDGLCITDQPDWFGVGVAFPISLASNR